LGKAPPEIGAARSLRRAPPARPGDGLGVTS
jgi:hypothetical protein